MDMRRFWRVSSTLPYPKQPTSSTIWFLVIGLAFRRALLLVTIGAMGTLTKPFLVTTGPTSNSVTSPTAPWETTGRICLAQPTPPTATTLGIRNWYMLTMKVENSYLHTDENTDKTSTYIIPMLLLSLLISPSHLNLLPEPVEVGLLPVDGHHHPHHVRVVPQELWNLCPKRGFNSCRGPVEPLPFKSVSITIGCWCEIVSTTKVVVG